MTRKTPPYVPGSGATASEIAVAAARLIADEGFDYATAKRRAAQELLGDRAANRTVLPNNAAIESELRRHLRLFGGDEHPARLAALRREALAWMHRLRPFNPHLAGAVLNGTATAFSDIQLHLFADSAKDVEIFLLNEGIDFQADDGDKEPGGPVERLRFAAGRRADGVGLIVSVFETDAIRVAPRGRSRSAELHPVEASGRASIAQLTALLDAVPL